MFASSMVKNKHNKLPNHKPVNLCYDIGYLRLSWRLPAV